MLQRTIVHDGRAALGDNLAIMKTLVVLLSLTLPLAAFADADGALRPTRMQMCQHELKDAPEAQRPSQLNTCLQRRAKAEAAMERECRRESQAIKGSKPRETDELRRHAPLATDAQINACLINKAEQNKVLAMTKFATETVKVQGTPSFTLNGKLLADVYDWKSLEPLLASR